VTTHSEEARRQVTRITEEVRCLEAEMEKRQYETSAAGAALQQARQHLSGERTRYAELVRSVEGGIAALPEDHRAMGETLDEASLQALSGEMANLTTAPEQLENLEQAERDYTQWDRDLARNREECEIIPPEARRPLDLLDLDEHDAQQEWEDADSGRARIEREQNALLDRQALWADLSTRHTEATRQHGLYRTLVDLLGRDGLQRHLLQQAEARIVEAANGVLDQVSSGTLRLALRSAARGTAKALDLVAYQTVDGVETDLGVAYLSRSRGTTCITNTSTIAASHCVPRPLRRIAAAWSALIAARYGWSLVIASKLSATAMTRAPKGMSSPCRPAG
jgi:exonuclease SbcC